jgi:hypothetical protein
MEANESIAVAPFALKRQANLHRLTGRRLANDNSISSQDWLDRGGKRWSNLLTVSPGWINEDHVKATPVLLKVAAGNLPIGLDDPGA